MLTIMNPDDKAGLEAALRLKMNMELKLQFLQWDFQKLTKFFVKLWLMGADEGILVTDRVLEELIHGQLYNTSWCIKKS